MPGDGIADDSDAYADLADAQDRPGPSSSPGIASDADLFAGMLEESTDKARSLDTNWLYQQQGQVFGPVKSKELLEMLYKGEVDAKTMIAVEDGEFSPLGRIGVFRAHLPKVEKHLAQVRAAEAAAKAAAKQRLVKRTVLIVGTTLVVGAAAVAIPWYIISAQKAQAEGRREGEGGRAPEGARRAARERDDRAAAPGARRGRASVVEGQDEAEASPPPATEILGRGGEDGRPDAGKRSCRAWPRCSAASSAASSVRSSATRRASGRRSS